MKRDLFDMMFDLALIEWRERTNNPRNRHLFRDFWLDTNQLLTLE